MTVKYRQRITYTSHPVKPKVGGDYVVTADGGGSGRPVTFTIDQAGNAGYAAAPTTRQNVAVKP